MNRATAYQYYLIACALACTSLFPLLASAGSTTYSTPGTYYLTIPWYSSITANVYGAGGGGGESSQNEYSPSGSAGSASYFRTLTTDSSFDLIGYGGGGGTGGWSELGEWVPDGFCNYEIGCSFYQEIFYHNGSNGSVGGWTGYGASGSTGGGAAGGAGGTGCCWGFPPYGGAGGAGGLAYKTWTKGQAYAPVYNSTITIIVGSGGASGAYYSPSSAQAGSNGSVTITWTAGPAPTCSLSVSPSPVNQPNSSTLTWSSTDIPGGWFYISNVGYVSGSGSTTVAPSTSTTYSGTVSGPGGTGSCSTTLTVYGQCTLPWGGTIQHGQSVTAYQHQNVGYGQTCTSQTRTCTNGTLSGSYQYQSCTVAGASGCTLDGVTVNHGDSRTFYNVQTAPEGEICSSTGESGHSLSRACTNGTLSGSSSYQYASCSCTPQTVYSCSPDNVVRTVTGSNCSTTVTNPYATCTSPNFCTAGSAACITPAVTGGDGDDESALSVVPSLVMSGETTEVSWDTDNATSCSVEGSNGDSWSATSSTRTSSAITGLTTYTLSCDGGDEDLLEDDLTDTDEVNLIPIFQEL